MRLPAPRSARFDDPNLVSCAGLVPVDGVGRPVRPARAARRAGEDRREGRRQRRDEDPRADRGHGRAARTRSTTWTCCATAACAGCSTGCGRPRRWGRSCGCSPSATSANSTPSPPGCCPARGSGADPARRGPAHHRRHRRHRAQTYGYAKQGAGRGYTGVKGLNALLAIVSTTRCRRR